ncbi:response regulator transcription factor [Thiohalocapsa sp. ML1]|jgi:DNA-binding NarL/FixJ family response regulator|uniref:response regulator transcription factor n=1 Tax=Thiohalocapsa sp. ML1 TaxID=1431688 RepID=UPI0007320499|nr:response regulator transcription factor [Thiohalocapsa sp. ML1]
MLDILIADDHALLREGLAAALATGFPACRIAQCDTWAGVHRCIEALRFDLILLDLFMPRRRAWEFELRGLLGAVPDTPVCILSASAQPAHVQIAAEAGVRAYVVKTVAVPEIVAILRRVLSGDTVFPPPEGPAPAFADTEPAARLTPRQMEIVERLAAGATNREIAETLGFTEHTAKRHVLNICRKLGAGNRVEAVAIARAVGLLTRY